MREETRLYRYRRFLMGERVLLYDNLFFRRKLTLRRAANSLLAALEARMRIRRPHSYPIALQLEPTIHCQLDCPYCPRMKAMPGMELGHMKWNDYERLLAEVGPHITAIAFWQWGEPLLHPRIADMVALANRYGLITFMSTNAQAVCSETDFNNLVSSGLDMMIVSMDGATQEVYEKFRVGGELAQLKRFVDGLVQAKQKLAVTNPIINIRVVATSENEGDIEAVRDYARSAGADVFCVKSVSLYHDDDVDHPSLPRDRQHRSFQYRDSAAKEQYRCIPNYCRKPWAWPMLRYDGTLLFCECDHTMTANLGNVFVADSFRTVWQGPVAQNFRDKYHSNGTIDLEFCQRCRYKLDDAIRRVEHLT